MLSDSSVLGVRLCVLSSVAFNMCVMANQAVSMKL